MPEGLGPSGPDEPLAPKLSLGQRLLLGLPRLRRSDEKPPLGERLRDAVLKPVEPDQKTPAKPTAAPTVEELEDRVRYADDRERFIGLFAAPLAALVALVVTSSLIGGDPAARLSNGQINPRHVPVSDYHSVLLVLMALALITMVSAWLRKRLFLGVALALFGLAVFNLHYWGFGIPFLLGGAWYLVHAYRAHRALKEATQAAPGLPGTTGATPPPSASKRYTPRSAPRRRPPAKPDDRRQAG